MVESISMTWKYNDEDFLDAPKGIEGFVYLITNTTNDRKYIGKKSFWDKKKDKTGRRKQKKVIGKLFWFL